MLDLDYAETRFIIDTVQAASQLVTEIQQALVAAAITKDDRSPVTVADFAAQALVGRALAHAFPDDLLVAEEDSHTLRAPESRPVLETVTRFVRGRVGGATPEEVCDWIDHNRAETAHRFWTLDPIDGTKGFLRGDQYVIALALVEEGEVVLGALACPELRVEDLHLGKSPVNKGVLALARRGQGAWLAPLDAAGDPQAYESIGVSPRENPRQARLMRSFEAGHTNVGQIDRFAEELGIEVEPVRMDSQAKYVVLAAGGGELMLRLLSPKAPDYREKIWDQAAGSLILEEAGGRITDLDGRELDFRQGRLLRSNRGVLASNSLLHDAALRALRSIGA